MDLLYSHQQEKREKSTNLSSCDLKLYRNDVALIYASNFDLDYKSYGKRKHIRFEHQLTINLKTGNIKIIYKIVNDGLTNDPQFRNHIKNKENNFILLEELLFSGFLNGERKYKYWGINYIRAINKIFDIIHSILHPRLKTEYYINKDYRKIGIVNLSLYDLIVDFHLDMKGIKGHNSVYCDIKHDYPKKKWLSKNDNKFLPAVLDDYGMKTKYFISEINNRNFPIIIKTLKYMCTLFGNNYIDYIKQIPWMAHCFCPPPNTRVHVLKTETEKKNMVETLKKWYDSEVPEPFVVMINKLLTIRSQLEPLGYVLKYDIKNYHEFENLLEMWDGYKKHITRGYKLRYNISPKFREFIERDIIISDGRKYIFKNGEIFKPKLLLTEEDYRIEGHHMKNCMAKQFSHGAIYLFVSLQHKRKRINLQYRKGLMVQSYGKANTVTPELFNDAIKVLNDRFIKYRNVEWQRVKYDFIKKQK
jgi:hypothetical protein